MSEMQTRELNPAGTSRIHKRVGRRGWDGSREEIAISRLLVGIGGGALALQGARLRYLDRRALAGSAEARLVCAGRRGRLEEPRRWFREWQAAPRAKGDPDLVFGSVCRIVPGQRPARVDADGRLQAAAFQPGKPLMFRALRVPIGRRARPADLREIIADNCLGSRPSSRITSFSRSSPPCSSWSPLSASCRSRT